MNSRQALDAAVGENVHCAIFGAQHRGAQIDLFHQAGLAVDHGHIIDADLILHH